MTWLKQNIWKNEVLHFMSFEEFLTGEAANITRTVGSEKNAYTIIGPWSGPIDSEGALDILKNVLKANRILTARAEKDRYSILIFTPMDMAPDTREKVYAAIDVKAAALYETNLKDIHIFEGIISDFSLSWVTI